MKHSIIAVLLTAVSLTAFAGTYPEYVTMKDGSVCNVPLFGNGGQYSLQNYLGLDYDTCESPGIDKIWHCLVEGPIDLPECSDTSGYPCYERRNKPRCSDLKDELTVSPGPDCED